MRSKEEIKKGLECAEIYICPNKDCPYYENQPCSSAVQIDALSLIRHLESNQMKKPLTLEEALEAKAVHIEDDGCEIGVELYPALYFAKGHPNYSVFLTGIYTGSDTVRSRNDECGLKAWLNNEEYGITWRCWASRPTEEERAAAKWEEDKRDTDPVQ